MQIALLYKLSQLNLFHGKDIVSECVLVVQCIKYLILDIFSLRYVFGYLLKKKDIITQIRIITVGKNQ